ncbi:MAG: hypothetical protein Kow0096_13690 [Thiohalomonadaceae bacterium]
MLFGNDRTALRRFYLEAWRKLRNNQPLEPLERQVAEVVSEHPEYHALLESEDTLAQDYTPEMGQSNPFLHLGLHLAIREQLGGDRPAGIVAAYRALLLRLGDPHTVEHHMMECLGQALWEAQRAGRAPDEAAYLACLKKG